MKKIIYYMLNSQHKTEYMKHVCITNPPLPSFREGNGSGSGRVEQLPTHQ
jgi:hypothetical protein